MLSFLLKTRIESQHPKYFRQKQSYGIKVVHNGSPRKLLDVSKAEKLGWRYKTELEDGIRLAYDNFHYWRKVYW